MVAFLKTLQRDWSSKGRAQSFSGIHILVMVHMAPERLRGLSRARQPLSAKASPAKKADTAVRPAAITRSAQRGMGKDRPPLSDIQMGGPPPKPVVRCTPLIKPDCGRNTSSNARFKHSPACTATLSRPQDRPVQNASSYRQ